MTGPWPGDKDEEDERDDDLDEPVPVVSPTPAGAPDGEEDLEINGYRLIREINRGGQAVVFLAIQKSTGRKVALKVMFSGPFASDIERHRMDQEVRILAALDHPNIVSVIDRGATADGSQYFVTNFVDGRSLNEFLDDYRKDHGGPENGADLGELLRIFKRICEAVNAAHLRGIVHRDLKPANIIIDAYGEPHILDFGLAHSAVAMGATPEGSPTTRTGEFVGSLEWASPEQASGEADKIDTRTDVYALGVILYEMLAGDFPYEVFGELRHVLDAIVKTRPEPPSRVLARSRRDRNAAPTLALPVDPALDAIVLKALAKTREGRYQTAGELARDLGRYIEGHRPAAWRGRSPLPFVAAALLFVSVGVGGVVWFLLRQKPESPFLAPIAVNYADGIFGYAVDSGEVVFVFEPDRFDVFRHEDGRLDAVSNIDPIQSVQVVGAFNAWRRDAPEWRMLPTGDGRFELVKSARMFSGRPDWAFKFLVNGMYWIGAPATAQNREIVVADTATFNMLLENPAAAAEKIKVDLRGYRAQIHRAWPGQGANLALDETNRFHFTFSQLAPGQRITDLEPLRGIPLTSLDLGVAKVTDMTPLAAMKTLERVTLSEGSYLAIMAETLAALRQYDFDAAEQAAEKVFRGLTAVPAFARARQLTLESIANLRFLNSNPGKRPPNTSEFAGRAYALILFPMNWTTARQAAERWGGALASAADAERNDWLARNFAQAALGRTVWLGGTDENTESYWRWLNGEGWRFEHWNKPEPNNNHGNEHALALKPDAWWIDADGNGAELCFLVEWPR